MGKELEDSGFVIWLTGLPGSGKTTIARGLEKILKAKGIKLETFDGDEVRRNLSKGLGFSKEDRDIHNKRVIYVCKLLTRNGVNAIVSLISPYRSTRAYAREQLLKFVEVYLKCSVEECIRRDPKGLYKKALAGEITNMTGIQDPYEEPTNPEVTLDTENDFSKQNIQKVVQKLQNLGYFKQ
jgi:adenylyl-sulfate kinase